MKAAGRGVRGRGKKAEIAKLETEIVPALVKMLWKKKASDIAVLDVRKLVYYTDFVVICSGRTDRHVKALYKDVLRNKAKLELPVPEIEGSEFGRWVLMDFSSLVLHIFLEPLREHYDIERLWIDAPRINVALEPREKEEEEDGD